MSKCSEEVLRPRNGHTLRVLGVSRISGCANQKELSLDDQHDNIREIVNDLWDGPVEYDFISTKAKGERVDRPELQQIEAAYKSGKYDLFVFDDLSRLIRGGEAARLLGVGVDNGTRTICISDGIDTHRDGTWEEDSLNACSENVAHNERTSKRIKQKCMNRFRKTGSPTGRPIAGYIIPAGVKSYDGWLRNEIWTEIILEGAKLLLETLDCAIVADLFNHRQFPTGPYARRTEWSGPMVRKFYGNTLLKGFPQRGARHTVKNHATGRRISVVNPKGPTYYAAPHLAFFIPEYFDQLNQLLDAKNAHHRRPDVEGSDPLLGRSRKHSAFPGTHSRCWYCGHPNVWGGNGQSQSLMCRNSREWHCWHSLSFSGPLAIEKIVAAICDELKKLPDFGEQFAKMVASAGEDLQSDLAEQWRQLTRDEQQFETQSENVRDSIKKYGAVEFLEATLNSMQVEKQKLLLRRHQLQQQHPKGLILPESTSTLTEMMQAEFRDLAINSPAFGKLMRAVVPEIFVYAVRSCDGGHLLPRARVTINLAGKFPDVNLIPGAEEMFTKIVTLDFFNPTQRERIRKQAVELSQQGLGPKAIAAAIEERPSAAAVQKALALHKKMLSLGLSEPYVTLLVPPEDYPKQRRHKHSRYSFQKREGYDPPEL